MTEAEIRAGVHAALHRIAPEVDPATLRPAEGIRAQADIDSVDFLRFLVAIRETLGVDVPETDYGKLESIDGCVCYLLARLTPSGA